MSIVDTQIIDSGFPWRPDDSTVDQPDAAGGDPSKRGPRPADPDYNIELNGPTERHGIPFDTVVHAVDDLDWSQDQTNSFPARNNTLIAIPEGTWTVDRNVLLDIHNWGVVGLGPNVTLRPPKNRCIRMIQASGWKPSENILLENIEFDQRDDMTSGIEIVTIVTDGAEVHHCSRTGKTPNEWTAGPPYEQEPTGLSIAVVNEDGRANFKHWVDECETEVIDYPYNGAGAMVPYASRGVVRFEDCIMKNQGEHAIYGSKAHQVQALRCLFVDNANTNLRIAGEGSWAKDCIIGFQRDADYTRHRGPKPGKKATKMLRAENERYGESGGYFENCEFYSETPGLVASYVVYVMGSVGATEFRDCLIRNEVDDDDAVIEPIGSGWRHKVPPGEDWIRFVRCRFEGDSEFPPIVSKRPGLVYAKDCVCSMKNAPKAKGLARHGIEYVN